MTTPATETTTDRIEREIDLKAPRSRVWRALTDSKEFGAWFRAEMRDAFAPGARARGQITHPGYEHVTLDLVVERMEPEHLFSYRWHPYAVDPAQDYSREPTTLVVFELTETPGGTHLKVTESGFDQIPLARRDEAFRKNSGGWKGQVENIARYVESA